MSIFYICGKPGGGKSYLGVKQIIAELSDPDSKRFIVTNIVLNCAEIAAWLHENVKHEVNLSERVRVLDDAEAGEFWLYEPHREFQARRTIQMKRRSYDVPDFEDRAAQGTLYVIDEVHQYFGARDWQQTGTDCTFFLTQHRKLQCDVIFITQHPEQTDKALRRLAQEYMSVRNLSREPVLGFNLASVFGSFRFVRSLNSPQSANPSVFDSGFVDLKPEVYGKFYDTMAGVGIAGRVTVPKTESRGRSVWWLAVPIVVLLLGGVFVFTHIKQINSGIAHGLSHMLWGSSVATNMVPNVHASVAGGPAFDAPGAPSFAVGSQSAPVETNEIFCTGFCVLLGQPIVFLSDGTTVKHGIDRIEEDVVVIRGKSIPVRGNVPFLSADNQYSPMVSDYQPVLSTRSKPVNRVDILPAIHARGSDPVQRLNGFSSMNSQSRQPSSSSGSYSPDGQP
jgi:hypothetical protein